MKYRILQKLKENIESFVSGGDLSQLLDVSRTAVWKHIVELKKEGYVIESYPKKGYKLISAPDLLNPGEITYELKTKKIGNNIQCLDIVDSTNTYAKKLAYEGCEEGTVVVTDLQTGGRGRIGRKWSSSGKSGIWMSIVLRPSMAPEEVQTITLAASVAVVRAIEKAAGITAGIKWPNDIILDGKKVCGILTEMSSETDRINYIVVGIGINVNQDEIDFPEDLRDKAISLKAYFDKADIKEAPVSLKRSELIKEVLFEMEQLYEKINTSKAYEIIEEWKKYSVTIGKEVRVVSRSAEYKGVAEDITKDGRLVVKCDDGSRRDVLSGEISVRGTLGYA